MASIHRVVQVQGLVQGVGFRASAMAEAQRIGLPGTAMNLPTGSVEIHIEGSPEQVEAFTRWAARGPLLAKVTGLTFTDGPVEGLTGQRIIR